jgi:hypothetical protein
MTDWPELRVADWSPTRDTLHLWTQIVGKVRMVRTPLINHWWNITFYVSSRGLTTSPIPDGTTRAFQIDFDFTEHALEVTTTDGAEGSLALEPMSVARFYRSFMHLLDDMGLHTDIWPVPVEIPGAVPFEEDETHRAYDAERVHDYWRLLVAVDRVFRKFRAGFIGKASPVHLYWGAFDLAASRFSGRPAPRYRQRQPNCGPFVMEEAYSHEVSSAGYWPGPGGEGNFYSYAYPEPEGFRDAPIVPEEARYDTELGEFLLPYSVVRTAADPDATLLAFLQSAYEAAANAARWDRAALERR